MLARTRRSVALLIQNAVISPGMAFGIQVAFRQKAKQPHAIVYSDNDYPALAQKKPVLVWRLFAHEIYRKLPSRLPPMARRTN